MQGIENVYGFNLAINPGLDTWNIGTGAVTASGGLADGWTLVKAAGSTVSFVKDTANQEYGAACLAATHSVYAANTYIIQHLSSRFLAQVKGKSLSVRFRVKAPANGMVKAFISTDGGTTRQAGQLLNVNGKYWDVFVEGIAIPSTATDVAYGLEWFAGNASATYVDSCTLSLGGSAERFENTIAINEMIDSIGLGYMTGMNVAFVTANKTVAASTDEGIIQLSTLDGIVYTLPATVVGQCYIFMNVADDGAASLAISPNASDQINGLGITGADNKDLINTKATAKRGDFAILIGDGTAGVGWHVLMARGIWAREA